MNSEEEERVSLDQTRFLRSALSRRERERERRRPEGGGEGGGGRGRGRLSEKEMGKSIIYLEFVGRLSRSLPQQVRNTLFFFF